MIALFAALLLQTTPIPSAEAETLGRRLAGAGTLAAILPMMIDKDLADLAREDATLTAAERATLAEIGKAQAREGRDRLFAAIGHAYAARLSVAELRELVRTAESPASRRLRAIAPAAMAEAMATIGRLDLKKDVAARFCAATGKLCHRD